MNLLLKRCQAGDVGGKIEKVRGARRNEPTQSETQAGASTQQLVQVEMRFTAIT